MKTMNVEQYYSLEDVASELKIAYLTVYRWVQDGKLLAHQVGKKYRVSREDLDAFLNSRKTTKSPKLHELTKDQLINVIKQLRKQKKFGLVWEDKPEAVAELLKTHLPVLEEIKSKEITDGLGGPVNILIEGDNYHALSVLSYTHKRKIDLIYIDPPYNTGNKSWKYNNDYVERDDRYRHSKWLSFMRKRLELAKGLLKVNGSIIVAIDDYEVHHLGLLLEELFPNFIRDLVVVEHHPQGAGSNTISRTHEYAFICTPNSVGFLGRKISEKEGNWSLKRSGQGENNWRANRPKQFYAILVDPDKRDVIGVGPELSKSDSYQTGQSKDGYIRIYPIDKEGKERVWRYNRDTMRSLIEAGVIQYTERGSLIVKKDSVNQVPVFSIWKGARYNAGANGSSLLTQIMGTANTFPYPKSLWTTYDMLDVIVGNNPNATILDFFAGSGTTGHAVLELNSQDDGSRSFILCTNNEDNDGTGLKIASDICYPRIAKIINGYPGVKGLGGNLKYYKTTVVDGVKTDNDKRRFVYKSTEMLCLAEKTFTTVKVVENEYAIFESKDKVTGILFDEDSLGGFKRDIKNLSKPLVIYVFSYDHTHNEEDFDDLQTKQIKPIPEAILNVYRKIFKKTNRITR